MAFYNGFEMPGMGANLSLAPVDPSYNPESENAQSGVAVAQALNTLKLPITNGSGNASIVINEGIASGDYSIAGGTTDKEFIEDLVGATAAAITKLNKAEAQGALSISLGADNIAQSGGSVALGYKNISGAKGYYFDDIDFSNKTITLSTTRRTSTLVKPTYPSSVDWAVGDTLFIVNDDRYFLTISAVNENIITVEELPFSEIMYPSVLTVYTYSNPSDRTIVNVNKPKSGSAIIGWGAIGIGSYNTIIGNNSYGLGYKNSVAGDFGAAFGQENTVGYSAFATGIKNKALGKTSVAEGINTSSTGLGSHSEGGDTEASGNFSHAQGKGTKATGYTSFAQGLNSEALEDCAFAGGNTTKAKGKGTVALGKGTVAEKDYAFAEGYETYARGRYSHAAGYRTTAYTDNTFASGEKTYAGYKNQFTLGQYNNNKKDTLFEIGNGSSDENRTNAFEVYKDGTAKLKVQGESENSVVIKQYVDNKISSLNGNLFNLIYPIGSVYMTIDKTFNPRDSFGGTWEGIVSDTEIIHWKRIA